MTRKLLSTIAALAVGVSSTMLLTTSEPAVAAVGDGNPFEGAGDFTVVTTGDARFGNVEIEGSIAVGGDVTFLRGYPIIHSSGLTPTNYSIPQYEGFPVRLAVAGQFDVAGSSGVTEVSSRSWVTADQIGRVLLGDTSNVSINPRGGTGQWISALGTNSGTEPAIYIPDVVNQPADSILAPTAYSDLIGDVSGYDAWNDCLASLPVTDPNAVTVTLEPGSHGGARNLTLTEGVTNVLTLSSDDLVGANYRIELPGAQLSATTPLVVNITQGSSTSFTIPEFLAAANTNASSPNVIAPYVVYNLVDWTAPATIGGNKISGSIFAPGVDLTLQQNSPFEGQLVAGSLTTAGGEIHHYLLNVSLTCGTPTVTYSLGNQVWFDDDNDGRIGLDESVVPGVTVELWSDPNGDGVPDAFLESTTTDVSGLYLFTDLAEGSYVVVIPSSEFTTGPLVGYRSSDPTTLDPNDGTDGDDNGIVVDGEVRSGSISLGPDSPVDEDPDNDAATPDANSDLTIDFGFLLAVVPSVSVGDFVFVDENRDGVQDAGDKPVPGATLSLTGPDGQPVTDVFGNPVGPVLTDADGLYSFDGLPVLAAGESYTVTIDPSTAPLLDGYVPTTAGVGDPALDSSTGSAVSGDLVNDGDRDPTLDFGFVAPSVSVGDLVWFDADRDGLQDAGEAGIEGVTLTLTGPDGQPVTDVFGNPVDPVLTDADGLYSFDGLPVLAAGESYTVTVTDPAGFEPTVAEVDPVTGSSTGTAASGDLTVDGDRDPTLDFGYVQYDLEISKTLTSSGPFVPGGVVTYELVVTNNGPADELPGYSVTDLAATGLTITSMTGDGFTCVDTVCTADAGLSAGASSSPITVTAAIAVDASGELRNVAYVTPANATPETNPLEVPTVETDTTTSPTNNDDEAVIFVTIYDLALVKVADVASVAPDGTVTWTVRVQNQGNVPAGEFTVTDTIPTGMAFDSADNGGVEAAGVVTWVVADLAVDAFIDLTYTTMITDPAAGPFHNWAEISADGSAGYGVTDEDSTPDTDTGADSTLPNDAYVGIDDLADAATDQVPGDEDDNDDAVVTVDIVYDLQLIKTVVAPTTYDGVVTYTITVLNQGNVESGSYEVTDFVPAGLAVVDAGGGLVAGVDSDQTITWSVTDSLAPGASASLTFTAEIVDFTQAPFRNVAEISADGSDVYGVTDIDSTPDADPTDDVQDIDQVELQPGDAGFNDPAVDSDDHDIAVFDFEVVYDLALAKVAETAEVAVTDDLVWRVRLHNQGNVPAGEFIVTDQVPTGLTVTFVEVQDSTGATLAGVVCSSGATVTCTIPGLAVGDFVDVVITSVITDQDISTAPWRNWAEITADSAQAVYGTSDIDSVPDADTGADDTVPNDAYVGVDELGPTYVSGDGFNEPAVDEDDNDDAVITTSSFYDLALVKVASAEVIAPDGSVTFTITVANQGTLPSGDYVVTDTVPLGLEPVAGTYLGAVYDALGRTLTWNATTSLAPGKEATFTYDAEIVDVTRRPFRNIAEISSDGAADYGITDVDSTPDTDTSNDGEYPEVGSTPGTTTDNLVIDEAGNEGEEDDADIADVTTQVVYDLALSKVVDATDLIANGIETGTATYTVVVKNQGTVPSGEFNVVDLVPAGLVVESVADGGVYDEAAGTITWTIPNLASQPGCVYDVVTPVPCDGETTTVSFVVSIDPDGGIQQQGYRNFAAIGSDSADDYSTPTETVTDIDSVPGDVDDDPYGPLGESDPTVDNDSIDEAGIANDPNDDQDIADLTFEVVYDLALAKVVDTPVVEYGDTVTFSITVANQGNVDSQEFTVTDQVPLGMTPVEPVPNGGVVTGDAATGFVITWTIDNIDPFPVAEDAGEATLTYRATVTDPTQRPFRNVAEISADGADFYDSATQDVEDIDSVPDADPTNDGDYSALVEFPTPGDGIDNLLIGDDLVDEPVDPEDDADIADVGMLIVYDLQLIKDVVAPTSFDDPIVYTLTVLNQGNVPSGSYEVTDVVPAGLTVVDAGGGVVAGTNPDQTITWTITDSLEPGESTTVTFTAEISDLTQRPFRNVAEISADGADDYDTPELDVEDIDSTPDADPTNDVQDVDQVELQPGDDGFNDPELDSDDHDIAVFDFEVGYDLALVKVADAAVIDPDGMVTFTVTVQNQGNVPGNDFVVTDTLPDGLAIVDAGTGAYDATAHTLTWTIDQLQPGATTSRSFTMEIHDITLRPFRNVAEISVDSADDYDTDGVDVEDADSTPDTNVGNDGTYPTVGSTPGTTTDNVVIGEAGNEGEEDDADIADVGVAVEYDLALVKSLSPSQSYVQGSTIGYVIRVKNQGNVPSGSFTFQDVIPNGMSFVSASDGGTVSNGVVTWTVADLAAGETVFVTVGLSLDDVTLDDYTNFAEITTDSADDYSTTTVTVTDDDSSPDTNTGNDPFVPTDDVDTDQITGDEDDHDAESLDVAQIVIANIPPAPVTTPGELPRTGSEVSSMVMISLMLIIAGLGLFAATWRRRRDPVE